MSKLKELKERYSKIKTTDDTIKAILFLLEETDISKNPIKIHKSIWQLKQNRQYSEMLEDFSFNESGLTPFSSLLDQLLYRFEISGILGTSNPRYRTYYIRKKPLEDVLTKFSDEEIDTLKCMSKDFISNISN